MQSIVTKLIFSSIFISLVGCGGGGSDSSPIPTTPPVSNAPTWTAGVFQDEANFKNMCQTPRSGNDANGEPFPDQAGSLLEEQLWLRSWSNNTYLWYDEIVDQNPANFNDALSYFDVLKTDAITSSGTAKDQFHFTFDSAAYDQLVSSGASAGYGAKWVLLESAPPRDIRVAYTEAGSPATSANLTRGAILLEVDGIDAINAGDQASVDILNAALFPANAGETHSFTIRDLGSNSTRTINMTSAIVTADPVLLEKVIDNGSGKVGYMVFNTFGIVDAEKEIIDAIGQFQGQAIDDLVIDLRYNGGGFLAISSQLAYMVAGATKTANMIYDATVFNDKHPTTNPVTGQALSPTPFYDQSLGFSVTAGSPLPALNLNRVFVLSTANTCSASEALINGLRGINVEVVLIGDTTCGKPYGFFATPNCGTTYFTIQFKGENEKGFGDYADGFVPTQADNGQDFVTGCVVGDDFGHALGDEQEALLSAALSYRDSGSCPTVTNKIEQSFVAKLKSFEYGSLYNSEYLQRRLLLQKNTIQGLPDDKGEVR